MFFIVIIEGNTAEFIDLQQGNLGELALYYSARGKS
jgi:hypothetical protein